MAIVATLVACGQGESAVTLDLETDDAPDVSTVGDDVETVDETDDEPVAVDEDTETPEQTKPDDGRDLDSDPDGPDQADQDGGSVPESGEATTVEPDNSAAGSTQVDPNNPSKDGDDPSVPTGEGTSDEPDAPNVVGGGDGDVPVLEGDEPGSSEDSEARANFAFPTNEVTNVGTKSPVNLSTTLGKSGKPTLLWFWAPDCPACNAEAEVLEDFAAKYKGKLDVAAIGTDGTLAKAEAFVERNGTDTPLVVWDSTPQTWDHYGVTGGPFSILVDQSGGVIAQWRGMPPELFAFVDRLP